MKTLRGTLLTDGSSDRVLVPILEWMLGKLGCSRCEIAWAELRAARHVPPDLRGRIRLALDLYPCDLLFVHRDAERQSIQDRQAEIRAALPSTSQPHVCVVPVRMTEAWLLFDERAIRRASGYPTGRRPLVLPSDAEVENTPDPKEVLRAALKTAGELRGRRLRRFDAAQAIHLVARYSDDFSPLRNLAAFREVEAQARSFLRLREAQRDR